MSITRTLRILLAVTVLAAPPAPAADAPLESADTLVDRLVELFDARLALMPAVATAKWAANLPVSDPAREASVVAAAGERAATLGLTRAAVEHLYDDQIARARNVQQELLTQWETTGHGPDETARSLRDDLRPQIDRLGAAILLALYEAAPYLDTSRLSGALARLPPVRWTDAQRQRLGDELLAIHLDGPRSVARLQASGELRIGLPADYAPFALASGNRVSGVDVDLALDLAAALGLQPRFIRTSWKDVVSDLRADRFDLAGGGISITAARLQQARFTRALVRGGKSAIGRCADGARFAGLADIDQAGVRVIENPGGTNETFARTHLAHAEVRIHPDNIGVFDQIATGAADVMFTDDIEIARVSHQNPQLCRLLADLYDPADKALLLPPDAEWSGRLDPALNAVLQEQPYDRRLADALAR